MPIKRKMRWEHNGSNWAVNYHNKYKGKPLSFNLYVSNTFQNESDLNLPITLNITGPESGEGNFTVEYLRQEGVSGTSLTYSTTITNNTLTSVQRSGFHNFKPRHPFHQRSYLYSAVRSPFRIPVTEAEPSFSLASPDGNFSNYAIASAPLSYVFH